MPFAFVWVALSLMVVGCDVYNDDLLPERSGGADCSPPRRPPERPSGEDDGEDVGTLSFGLKDVVFEQRGDAWERIGLDLDDRCSRPPNPSVECVPASAGASPETDGRGGTDNVFGHRLYPLVSLTVPDLQETSREAQNRGEGALWVEVRGWNGEDADARVQVTGAVTVFGAPAADDGGAPDIELVPGGAQLVGGEPIGELRWDGTDYLWLRKDNFIDGDVRKPIVVDDNAYVRDRMLVITLPERTDFVFPGTDVGLEVRLTDAVAVARISDDRSRLEGFQVAGRWSVTDLVTTANTVGICQGSSAFAIFEDQLAEMTDVRSRAGTGGVNVPCDAISVGIELEGFPAQVGGLVPGLPVANACMEVPDAGGVAPDAGVVAEDEGDAGSGVPPAAPLDAGAGTSSPAVLPP